MFIGDLLGGSAILWPPDAKSRLVWKDADAGKDGTQKEKGVAEDEMIRKHHWFSGHESEHTPGDGGGQSSLMSYGPWDPKELAMT